MNETSRIPEDEEDPLLRSASPGEPSDSAKARQEQAWRERYPGWETFDGKPHDPRFMSSKDPNADPRYYTDLKNSSVLPRSPGLALWVWFLFVGIILLVLVGFAMYLHFQKPSPRSPAQTQIRQVPVRNVKVALADSLLPLRAQHRSTR